MHFENKIFYITEKADFLKAVGMTEEELDLWVRKNIVKGGEQSAIQDCERIKLRYYHIIDSDYEKATPAQKKMVSRDIRMIIRELKCNELLVVALSYKLSK